MNYRLQKIAPIIGADLDVLHDAARICGLRLVGNYLALSGKMVPTDFILEAQNLQRMKEAAHARRNQKAIQAQPTATA